MNKKTEYTFPLLGKIIIITGGASKFAIQMANTFFKKGVRGIALCDIPEKKDQIYNELRRHVDKKEVIYISSNAAVKEQFEEMFRKAIEHFKVVDVLINYANIFNDLTWEQEFKVNMYGTVMGNVLGLEEFLRKKNSSGKAVILNISPVFGLHGIPGCPIFGGIGAGIAQLTSLLGHVDNYKRTGVKVISICVGVTQNMINKLSPMNFMCETLYNVGKEFLEGQPIHPSECLITTIIDKIENAETGTIWYSKNGHVYEQYQKPEIKNNLLSNSVSTELS